jgi:protein SCO1/2
MRRSAVALALALALLAVAAGCGGSGGDRVALRGSDVPDHPAAPDLALRDQDGAEVTMAAQRGRWAIVTFLYTQCPDVCPVIAGNLNAALRSVPARPAGLRVLVVSVDPKRDTPAAVQRYARAHRLLPSFHWLVGSRAELAKVWRAYKVAVLPGPKGTITHSTFQLLVDPEGRERLVYDSTAQTADIVHDLRSLVGEE